MNGSSPSRPEKTVHDPDLTEPQPDLGGRESLVGANAASVATAANEVIPPRPHPEIPFLVPGYEGWRFLGAGTFGQVWRARHEMTTIPVAIKFFVTDAGEVEREVRRLAQLAHTPGIIRLEGVYPDAPVPYLVMEYADHGSLAGKLASPSQVSRGRQPPECLALREAEPTSEERTPEADAPGSPSGVRGALSIEESLRIFREIAEALAYVHSKGILHCDLKPGNVLLDSRDHVRLADFGQAQLASDLTPSLGTFFYMAPEQAQVSPQMPDTRWDVYALGAILYQMLTGHLPRHDEEFAETLKKTASLSERLDLYRARIADRPRVTAHRKVRGVDRDLADIVERCLDLDPEKRFADASAVLAALSRRAQRRKQRPMLAFGVVGPLLLMSLILLLSWWQSHHALAESSEQLAKQRLASNQDTARIVAHALQRNLRVRLDRVSSQAKGEGLLQSVVKNDREALEKFLDERLMLGPRRRPSNLFNSAWITNPKGRILAIRMMALDERGAPARVFSPDIEKEVHHLHEQFTGRDWFSGAGDRPGEIRPMVKELYVSDPYVTVVKGVGTVIAISMPIRRDPGDANSEAMGLLTASVRLETLGEWLAESGHLSDGGSILLLNQARDGKRSLLMDNGIVIQPKDKNLETYDFSDLEQGLKASGDQGKLSDHVHPLDEKVYLAGYARTTEPLGPQGGRLDWVVLVQHEKTQALRAVEGLRDGMFRFRLLKYGLTAVLMAGLWVWLFWLMRRQDSLARG
jgi:serine/threonine protein kinase